MATYFISGHLDLTLDEFSLHYVPKLNQAFKGGSNFVVGDARGADLMAQEYLFNIGADKVTVYHMFNKPRNNIGKFQTQGGFKNDTERDEAMTLASDDDIQKVLLGSKFKEDYISGTERNLLRRTNI